MFTGAVGAVVGAVGAVEVGHQVYGGAHFAGVDVVGVGVEDPLGLVGAVRGWREVARESEVDDLDDPLILGHVFGGIFVADGVVSCGVGVGDVGF